MKIFSIILAAYIMSITILPGVSMIASQFSCHPIECGSSDKNDCNQKEQSNSCCNLKCCTYCCVWFITETIKEDKIFEELQIQYFTSSEGFQSKFYCDHFQPPEMV
jgi:hypothetical protein